MTYGWGNTDLSVTGFLSDLPSIVHHTDTPVETHWDIKSNNLDIAQLTSYSKQDSIQQGFDEQIENLSLGLSFKSSAKNFTESKHLPKGEILC